MKMLAAFKNVQGLMLALLLTASLPLYGVDAQSYSQHIADLKQVIAKRKFKGNQKCPSP